MSDLISRQAAIDALARTAREKFNLSDEFNHYLAGLMDGEIAIQQLPPAQPERKKGKWLHDKDDTLLSGYCSRCGWESIIMETDVADMPYCPNCGSYNGGGNDEADRC